MSLTGFPSLDNVPGYPGASLVHSAYSTYVLTACLAAPKYILLADIWMDGDTGHNEDTTGLGYEYRWHHYSHVWATPYAGHVWVFICHMQSNRLGTSFHLDLQPEKRIHPFLELLTVSTNLIAAQYNCSIQTSGGLMRN
jgi:hypothetical protein